MSVLGEGLVWPLGPPRAKTGTLSIAVQSRRKRHNRIDESASPLLAYNKERNNEITGIVVIDAQHRID
jgi:hypothetical protein